ncbi:MAG: (2Fe-2S)-binding protein [Candidatus Thermoplasmatota archaeon]
MSTIVCRCEDLTEEDIVEAINEGYDELEKLKRHLRLGMGPCQGKTCMLLARRILARETGKNVKDMKDPTARPPSQPVPFRLLASPEGGEDDD